MSLINMIWILFCGTLILFMQAGFAMLETGFTRRKNAGNIALKNLMDICIAAPLFICVGFGIMFGKRNGIVGKLDIFLAKDYSAFLPEGVPLLVWVFFEMAFCATAATIVSGAMAERTRFAAYCFYSAILSTIVFPVVGHWIWGGGFLAEMGFHDFAGGTVVHTVGGVTAFAGAKILGPRIGKYSKSGKSRGIPGHNITLSVLGVMILWFGWYGFNGGSILSGRSGSFELAGRVFINTTIAATLSAVCAMIISKLKYKKADVGITVNGMLAGLVAITAGCDKVSTLGAVIIGIVAGVVLVYSVEFIDKKIKVDDPVGAVSAHGVSGIAGTWMTGLLAVDDGLFYTGKVDFFCLQMLGSIIVIVSVGIFMFIVFKILDATVGLRVEPEVEIEGLDKHEHGLEMVYEDFAADEMGMETADEAGVPFVPVEEAVPVENYHLENNSLYKVEIIVKRERFLKLKEAMNQIGVTGMTVMQVLGCGMQKGVGEYYRGTPVEMQLLPKLKVEIVLAKVPVEQVVQTARKVLYTGHIGDGKIFIYDVVDAVKIRTGAVGYDAMQGLQD